MIFPGWADAVTAVRGGRSLRHWMAWHPEWWVLGLSAVAWAAMLAPAGQACSCAIFEHWPGLTPAALASALGAWFVMVLAMMPPLMLTPMRWMAFASMWHRRQVAMVEFLAGYCGLWMAAGAGVIALAAMLAPLRAGAGAWMAAAAFFLAAAWQVTPLRRRCSAACHRTAPLAPTGWAADRDGLAFGAGHGLFCVGNCGLLMLAATLSPWPHASMVAVSLIVLGDRYGFPPRSRVLPVAIVALGGAQLLG